MRFEWDPKKSKLIKEKRGVSFEEIVKLITAENLLAVIDHPNQEKYPEQKIFVINIGGYAWAVPFEKGGDKLRLITAYPSRKLTKIYLRGDDVNKKN